MVHHFRAELQIIGINPYVFVPEQILEKIFDAAGKSKSPIAIRGSINGRSYRQTLVRYAGEWRLYINTLMLKDSPKRIGEIIDVEVEFDSEPREIEMPEAFAKALEKNKKAKAAFDRQIPSRQKEIVRYLAGLKSEEALQRNIERAIGFLEGKDRFIGRDAS
jgi:hypothetical protein